MSHAQKTTTGVIGERGARPGISAAEFGGELKLRGKAPVLPSSHHLGDPTSVLLALFGMGLEPRFSAEPGGASKLVWSVFTPEIPGRGNGKTN